MREEEQSPDFETRIERTTFELTTKDIVEWCRRNGHTPQRVVLESNPAASHTQDLVVDSSTKEVLELASKPVFASPFSRPSKSLYCKYCGASHSPRACPRKVNRKHLSSLATANLSGLKPAARTFFASQRQPLGTTSTHFLFPPGLTLTSLPQQSKPASGK